MPAAGGDEGAPARGAGFPGLGARARGFTQAVGAVPPGGGEGAGAGSSAGEGAGGGSRWGGRSTAGAGPARGLREERVTSSIPRGGDGSSEGAPKHQKGQDPGRWTYPSPRMFYDAMRRKGYEPDPSDMDVVVGIHNAVNERAWQEILRWERMHPECCEPPRLVRFQGKPQEYSVKARAMNWLGYSLPFDRHDWVVERCGRQVRYIIDFYNGPPGSGGASMHLDVRPAPDSLQALSDRAGMALRDWGGRS